jgi:hypothetical protein
MAALIFTCPITRMRVQHCWTSMKMRPRTIARGSLVKLAQADFFAVHESVDGPSRHIAAPRDLGRKRRIMEIDGPTSIAEGDANDP